MWLIVGAFKRREPGSFQVKIQKINEMDKIPCADFGILDIKMNGKMLELLIKYNSQKNPEVQLLQDEQSGKLYLIGGKGEAIRTGPGIFTLAKPNLAKIFIDLSPFEERAKIDIFEKIPSICVRGGSKVVQEASEDLLITILNFNECKVRMFGSGLYRQTH